MAVATIPVNGMNDGQLVHVEATKPAVIKAGNLAKLNTGADTILPEGITSDGINRYWELKTADSELVSTSITQTWTDQSIKCYVTCSDCNNCSIPRAGYSFACQMDNVVPALLATIGAPDEDRIEKLVPVLDRY
jgi:hypothetical protein